MHLLHLRRFATPSDLPETIEEDYKKQKIVKGHPDKDKVIKEFLDGCYDLVLKPSDLDLIKHDDCYPLDFMEATSGSEMALEDCLEQISALCYTGHSYYSIMKIWTPPGRKLNPKELRYLRRWYESNFHYPRFYNYVRIGLGYDQDLKPGEMKVQVIEFFRESWCDYSSTWEYCCEIYPLETLLEKEKLFIASIKDTAEERDWEMLYWDGISGALLNMDYCKDRTWGESKRVLDYLASRSDEHKHMTFAFADDLDNGYLTQREIRFKYNLLMWAIKNGGYINVIYSGKTLLDLLNGYIERADDFPRKHLRRVIDKITKMGAKSKTEIYAEEDLESLDYENELKKIKAYCSLNEHH